MGVVKKALDLLYYRQREILRQVVVKLAQTMKRATNASMAYIPCCSIVLMCYNLKIEPITIHPCFVGIETIKTK